MQVVCQKEEGGRVLEPPLAHERVGVLERRRPPLGIFKVVGKQLLRRLLLPVPRRHPPQALKDRLFAQRQVVQAAVYGVLEVALGVFVARNDLELSSL